MEAKLLEYYRAKKDRPMQTGAVRGQSKKIRRLSNSILRFCDILASCHNLKINRNIGLGQNAMKNI
ncbi:MAG TPA: hypothetical protein PK711_05540 [Bacteroidales bacterium]|nr:hypothetical protein [Bacteroidales bacterium]